MKITITLFSIFSLLCLSGKCAGQDYTVIQIVGECQALNDNQWYNIHTGSLFYNNAMLKNTTPNLKDVKLSFREIKSQNHYTISFKDSIKVNALDQLYRNDFPSRFSSMSITQVSRISKKEIAATTSADLFRGADDNTLNDYISAKEYEISNSILNRLKIQDNSINGLEHYENDPIISLMTAEDSKVLITNYSETEQFMLVIQIDLDDRIPVKAVSNQYGLDPMSESLIELTEGHSNDKFTILVSTNESINVDTLIDILNQKIDFPAKESKTNIGISQLVRI